MKFFAPPQDFCISYLVGYLTSLELELLDPPPPLLLEDVSVFFEDMVRSLGAGSVRCSEWSRYFDV